MERRTKDITRNGAGRRAAPGHNRALAALAAAVVTCGLAGNAIAQGASSAQSMKGESGQRPQAQANPGKSTGSSTGNASASSTGNASASSPGNATGNSKAATPKSDWTRHFTPEERDAWQQKIAAAPDEAEQRKLRGQRLAEIQRRTRAQKAEGGTGAGAQPTARPLRQASPEATTPAQRPR